jgi:hypothetical protein
MSAYMFRQQRCISEYTQGTGLRDDESSRSWNSSHPSRGCGQDDPRSSGGNGLFLLFRELAVLLGRGIRGCSSSSGAKSLP